MRANIPKLYLISAIRWFLLVMPVLVPFYEKNGLSTTEWTLIQSIFSIVIVFMEIPSGYFGDALGRKLSIVVGVAFGFAGWTAYALASGFWEFLAAELLMGMGGSFISGSDSALLYDSLLETGDREAYMRHEGRMQATGNFSEASAAILGGWLATISLRLPFYGQAALTGVALLVAFTLKEPPALQAHRKGQSPREKWLGILKAVRFAVWDHPLLRQYLLFSSIISSATLAMAWFAQPYFKLADIPLVWYGVLWTALNLSVGAASWFAYRLRELMNMRYIFWLVTVLVLAGYLGGAVLVPWLGIVCIFLTFLGRGIVTPLFRDLINEETPSEIRATVLSVRSFGVRLFFAGIGLAMGWSTDAWGLRSALGGAGLLYLLLAGGTLIVLGRMYRGAKE